MELSSADGMKNKPKHKKKKKKKSKKQKKKKASKLNQTKSIVFS